MKKNILLSLQIILFLFASIPSYAYIIGNNVVIDNQTDKNLVMKLSRPYAPYGDIVNYDIPAKSNITVYIENGDSTGLLYQARAFPFSISDAKSGIEQINGRVAFYVGGLTYYDVGMASRYSFLDSVQSSPSIHVKQFYSCDQSAEPFQSKLEITGNLNEVAAPAKLDNKFIQCKNAVEYSVKPIPTTYVANCTNNTMVVFMFDYSWEWTLGGGRVPAPCAWSLRGRFNNARGGYEVNVGCNCDGWQCSPKEDIKKEVFDDIVVGNQLCYQWQVNL